MTRIFRHIAQRMMILFLLLGGMGLVCQEAQAAPAARAMWDAKTKTLTFYYGEQKSGGTTHYSGTEITATGTAPAWITSDFRDNITKVVFESSFASVRPTRCTNWFGNMTKLTTITGINYLNTTNVTSMYAMFHGCSGLTSLNLSSFITVNVTNMQNMFNGCSGLTSLDLSSFNTTNVTDMNFMFYNCSGLTSLNLSSFNTANVTHMWGMFINCSSLTSLDLCSFNTANVTNMDELFQNCSNLQIIYVDESKWSTAAVILGGTMFAGCYKLVGGNGTVFNSSYTDQTRACIDKPGQAGYLTCATVSGTCGASGSSIIWYIDCDGVLNIKGTGSMADYTAASQQPWASHRDNITSIVIGSGITHIGAFAFHSLSNLSSITIPNSVTSIGNYAFRYCYALTSIALPNALTSIGTGAFRNCTGLTSITIPSSVTAMGTYVLTGTTNLKDIYLKWTGTNILALPNNFSATDKTVHIPCGTLSDYTNKGWSAYTLTVEINGGTCGAPGNEGNVRWSLSCNGVLTISGSGAMADFTASTTGYDGDGTNAPWNDYRSSITKVVLPYGLTNIGVYAFYYCTHLTDIDIPASVTSIGDKAFAGCTSLKQVCIPEGVTTIGSYLFFCLTANTSSLQRLYLPSTLTSMGTHVVYKCGNLRDFTIPASISGWSGNMRYNRGPKENVYVSWTENIPACPLANEIVPNPRAKLHVPYGKTSQYNTKQWYKSFIIVEDVDERAIDLGLSIRWASCNIGATSPEENGEYYMWADTLGGWSSYVMANYPYYKNGYSTRYNETDHRTRLIPFDDAAYIRWGETWRMPTKDEWNELFTQCKWEEEKLNDKWVYKVTGPNGNYIYIPLAGYKSGSPLYLYNENGYYWTSELSSIGAPFIASIGGMRNINSGDLSYGRSVRAVYRREWPSFTLTITDTPEGTTYTKAVNAGSTYTLTAQEDDCHRFVRWSDGNTNKTRTVSVTADATYTAVYDTEQFTVTVQAEDPTMGDVSIVVN